MRWTFRDPIALGFKNTGIHRSDGFIRTGGWGGGSAAGLIYSEFM
jgi:hypothetical protein